MSQLPKKWSRRVFAIYLAATIFGGIVLFLFIVLLGLLYMMNARVPLPDQHMLVPESSDQARLQLSGPSLNELPPGIVRFLTAGAPSQVERLIARRGANPKCLVQILISAAPNSAGRRGETSLVVSLGRYPGQFWLVRRDLEERVEKHALPLSLTRYDGKDIFVEDNPSSPFGAFSLAGCTFARSSTAGGAEALAGRLGKASEASRHGSGEYPAGPAGFNGMAPDWQNIPLEGLLPSASIKRWQDFSKKLLSIFPELAGIKKVEFFGTFPDADHADLTIETKTLKNVIPQDRAEKLAAWLGQHGAEIGVTSAGLHGALKDGTGITLNVAF